MQIITSPVKDDPSLDRTYFRMDDASPYLDGEGHLVIQDGYGRARGWGSPHVASTVYLHSEHLIAVHIAFYHKHGGDQGWRYYRATQGIWARVERFFLLTPDERRAVAVAWFMLHAQGKIPTWHIPPYRKLDRYL